MHTSILSGQSLHLSSLPASVVKYRELFRRYWNHLSITLMIKNSRATLVCLAKVIGHLKFFTVPVHHISTCTAWAEVQEGALGTHDVWVLLAPLGLASNLDDRIGILVDLEKKNNDTSVALVSRGLA